MTLLLHCTCAKGNWVINPGMFLSFFFFATMCVFLHCKFSLSGGVGGGVLRQMNYPFKTMYWLDVFRISDAFQ